jgi:hypothetical protein
LVDLGVAVQFEESLQADPGIGGPTTLSDRKAVRRSVVTRGHDDVQGLASS